MMYIFNTCRDWIRTVPTLPYSQTKPEDVDSEAEDHEYDATRYFLMEHPMAARRKIPPKYKPYDPLSR